MIRGREGEEGKEGRREKRKGGKRKEAETEGVRGG